MSGPYGSGFEDKDPIVHLLSMNMAQRKIYRAMADDVLERHVAAAVARTLERMVMMECGAGSREQMDRVSDVVVRSGDGAPRLSGHGTGFTVEVGRNWLRDALERITFPPRDGDWILVHWLESVDASLWISSSGIALRGDIALACDWNRYWSVCPFDVFCQDAEIVVGMMAAVDVSWCRALVVWVAYRWYWRVHELEKAWSEVVSGGRSILLPLSFVVRELRMASDLRVVAGE